MTSQKTRELWEHLRLLQHYQTDLMNAVIMIHDGLPVVWLVPVTHDDDKELAQGSIVLSNCRRLINLVSLSMCY